MTEAIPYNATTIYAVYNSVHTATCLIELNISLCCHGPTRLQDFLVWKVQIRKSQEFL